MTSGMPYPVRVDASLQPGLSRWLWLVKWLLAIPHFVILMLLWIAFIVLSVIAFVSILFTGRYPRPIFDFNVGVLRWHWRVAYYSYAAFGTDRYPPFTLADVPDYPAHLEIAYPGRLSRGLVLVKWWLLAIPHYLVAALFVGGGTVLAWQFDDLTVGRSQGGGLVNLLALIAVVILAFTGRYPRPIFDFILGMDRWVLRVAAYAALMTDAYPPFRLEMGGAEPGGTLTLPRPDTADPVGSAADTEAAPGTPGPAASAEEPAGTPGQPIGGWTAGRVVSVVAGAVLAVASVGAIGGGGALLWADQTQRPGGYLTTPAADLQTSGYALVSDPIDLWTTGQDWSSDSGMGDIRLRVTADDPTRPVFVGIAPADAADGYLAGVRHATVTDLGRDVGYLDHRGAAPADPPAQAGIWSTQRSGVGTQSLFWTPEDGRWVIVVMNADASAGVDVEADIGATVPALPEIAVGLLIGGGIGLAVAVVLLAVPIRLASRTPVAGAGAPVTG